MEKINPAIVAFFQAFPSETPWWGCREPEFIDTYCRFILFRTVTSRWCLGYMFSQANYNLIKRRIYKRNTSTKLTIMSERHPSNHLYSLHWFLTTSYSATAALSLPLMNINQKILHNSARGFWRLCVCLRMFTLLSNFVAQGFFK